MYSSEFPFKSVKLTLAVLVGVITTVGVVGGCVRCVCVLGVRVEKGVEGR